MFPVLKHKHLSNQAKDGVLVVIANALNLPPEEYDRKVKTQRNRRGPIQVVEHVV